MRRYNDEDTVSSEHLSVNCCGCQHLFGYTTGSARPNGRRDYHILYITEGTCFIRDSEYGEEIAAPSGSAILYLPGEPQFYRFYEDIRSTSYFIHFSGTACEELLERAGMLGGRIFDIGSSTSITTLFSRLIDDFYLAPPLYRELTAGYLQQLIALIGRKLAYSTNHVSKSQNHRIEEICRQMHRDYKKGLAISEYAQATSLSESRFSHLFKESTGVSPHRYLLEIRIARAAELLLETDLSVSQICTEIGIGDQNYFSRVFKKMRGCSPSAFRRRG